MSLWIIYRCFFVVHWCFILYLFLIFFGFFLDFHHLNKIVSITIAFTLNINCLFSRITWSISIFFLLLYLSSLHLFFNFNLHFFGLILFFLFGIISKCFHKLLRIILILVRLYLKFSFLFLLFNLYLFWFNYLCKWLLIMLYRFNIFLSFWFNSWKLFFFFNFFFFLFFLCFCILNLFLFLFFLWLSFFILISLFLFFFLFLFLEIMRINSIWW